MRVISREAPRTFLRERSYSSRDESGYEVTAEGRTCSLYSAERVVKYTMWSSDLWTNSGDPLLLSTSSFEYK